MRAALDAIFRKLILRGRLTVRWPDGQLTTYQGLPGEAAGLAISDPAVPLRLIRNPGLAFGEAYMDGGLAPFGCSLYELMDLIIGNLDSGGAHWSMRLRARLSRLGRHLRQYNPAPRARRNVAHHYDLNGLLYSRFLDQDRQYSCAYFARGDETLEEAQAAKKRHVASKLFLDRPGLSVLDIGCGWGGLALTLARDYGARVTGITLSAEQLAEARARADAAGLADRVSFELIDYRDMQQSFDRIVSVGMFEHVGVLHYRTFFEAVRRCLAPEGVGLLHTIGRSDGPGITNPWIHKYIFPGGYSPALSEIVPPIEASGLVITDIEVLRMHYAETLRHWRQRFAANREAIATLYDERFCRMFEFYLVGSELTFRRWGHVNFQIQLVRDARVLPITRDYMVDHERAAPARVEA